MLNSNARVSVVHKDSGKDYGTFRGKGGGGKTAEAQLVRPGAMAPPEAFPGPTTFEEATASKHYRHGIDSGLVQELEGLVNQRFELGEQPLDGNGQSGFHRPIGKVGLLTGVAVSDYDADGTDPRTLDLTFLIDATV